MTQQGPTATTTDVDTALAAAISRPTGSTAAAAAGKSISPLLPVKSQVLRVLMQILDDPKRDVRKAAVDARGAWLRAVSDGPDDDDDE